MRGMEYQLSSPVTKGTYVFPPSTPIERMHRRVVRFLLLVLAINPILILQANFLGQVSVRMPCGQTGRLVHTFTVCTAPISPLLIIPVLEVVQGWMPLGSPFV